MSSSIGFQDRRNWIKNVGLVAIGVSIAKFVSASANGRQSTILLVSGWQDVNIGDIGHTPGLLHVLETFLPEAKIILWKKSNGKDVQQMLNKNFPKVKIVYGKVATDFEVESAEVVAAMNESDLMIHGSGPSLVGADYLSSWIKKTNKPFGIFGTTLENPNKSQLEILRLASFIFTRETTSLTHLAKAGIEGKNIFFAPDATFYLSIHDKAKAAVFLKKMKLETKKFICVVPRLRYTPYHKFSKTDWSTERIRKVEETNDKYKEIDHAKLREAMIAWVRETGNKVLVCPEMTYEVDIMDELLIDPLPDDVKPQVLKRGYWLPDEAASVYAQAHTVLSFECHSPIIAAANGTPCFYLRQPEDTIKGQMYYDLGFDDWTFEIDQSTGQQITAKLREVWKDYASAKEKLKASMARVTSIYRKSTSVVSDVLASRNV